MKAKILDFLYRKIISKSYLEVTEKARKQGYEQGKADYEEAYLNLKAHLSMLNAEWFVNPLDVVTVNEKGIVMLDGMQITDVEAKSLKQEAKFLKNSHIYRVLQETLKQKAIEKSVNQSKNFEEVLAGKMMVHNLGIIKSVVDLFDKHTK